ncbi:inositol-pentakisphosphate 2-kinase [Abortiporus biennis]|nr:inositol-pentakisphosphate 2-kinase [Abortiporus biennis]
MDTISLPSIQNTSPADWQYISEGGSSIVFSYSGPVNPQFDGTALRLRKVSNDSPVSPDQSQSAAEGELEEPDDPTIVFQREIIQRLVPLTYLPRLEAVKVEREWVAQLAKLCEEKRPLERRAKDRIDLNRKKAVLATDLVGGKGWAVEIKPKWGFLPSPTHLSPATVATKTTTCRFCMHSHLKSTDGENVSLGYCPLDLFSGDTDRVKKALNTLWDVWIGSSGSVNNLRIFVEGQMLRPSPQSLRPLATQIIPSDARHPDLITIRDRFVDSVLPLLLDTPVLRILSMHQRNLDTLDIEGLSTLWKNAHSPLGPSEGIKIPSLGSGLTQPTIQELSSFVDIYLQKHAAMDHEHPDTANLQYYCLAYLLSASFKDCSIIMRIPPVSFDGKRREGTITVIDLDVKGVDRLSKWEKLDREIVASYVGVGDPAVCVDGQKGSTRL